MINFKTFLSAVSTPIKITSLALLSVQVSAEKIEVTHVSETLMNSTHIIKGTLRNSETQFKSSHNNKSNNPDGSVYTTYTFSVDEVIKGQHKPRTIEFSVKGGCDTENNYCEEFNHEYDYELDQQEILFLNFSHELEVFLPAQEVDGIDLFEDQKSLSNSSRKNRPPIAFISSVSCFELDCLADGSSSYDPDGSLSAFSWLVHDGVNGVASSNSFFTFNFNVPSPGNYLADLTVFDNQFASSRHSRVFNVPSPPPVFDEDDFDDISLRGYNDDYEGDAESISIGQTHHHNFHDAGDQDWSMFWSSVPKAMKMQTQLIGASADTTLEVFKVTDVRLNPNYPNQNRFIIDDMVLVGSDQSSGSSTVVFNTEAQFLYVIKTQSRTNTFGDDTEYSLTSTAVPITADAFDDVSSRGYSDDYQGDAEGLSVGESQIHNFHDNGDTDWTMVWSGTARTLQFKAEMIGPNSDAKIAIYKVTDIVENPNHPGQNRFIINNMQLVASNSSVGNSSVTFATEANFLYVMKTESRTNSSGAGTEYRSRLNQVNN